ncbi:MAG TPA: kelch repeat-containing protein, partial [Kofleriaceae bacterium]|nr:kelch repeat-containing protein [Kofleriaceae bacterium]
KFTVRVTEVEHPVTKGLQAFEVEDELYFQQDGDEPIEPLRLYFARAGSFRDGAAPLEPERSLGLMFSDERGIAVVAGGLGRVVELFDPRVGAFHEVGEMAVSRVGGAVAVRDDGTAIVAGGVDGDGALVGLIEEIASSSGEPIRQIGPDNQADAQKAGLALVALPDRSVLMSGGRTAAGFIVPDLVVLEAGDDRFRGAGFLAIERGGHTASVGLGGVVYLIGGLTRDEGAGLDVATGTIELYRPQDQSVRTLVAELAVPRHGHTATVLEDGRILLVGGLTPDPICPAPPCAIPEVEVFDPIVGETRTVDEIPGGIHDHTATAIAGGRVLITGGRDSGGDLRSDAYLFDPDVEALVPTRSLGRPRAEHTASELCDGTVLLVGGVSADGTPLAAERYNPASRAIP